jgi:hypothetical protein
MAHYIYTQAKGLDFIDDIRGGNVSLSELKLHKHEYAIFICIILNA